MPKSDVEWRRRDLERVIISRAVQGPDALRSFTGARLYQNWPELEGRAVQGFVTELDPKLVAAMPALHSSVIEAKVDGVRHSITLACDQTPIFPHSLRFFPNQAEFKSLRMQVDLMRAEVLANHVKKTRLFPRLRGYTGNILQFDLETTKDDVRFPPFNASEFIPWALKVYEGFGVGKLMAAWEPGSVNYERYMELVKAKRPKLNAVAQTWTYQQFAEAGYGKIEAIDTLDLKMFSDGKQSEGPGVILVLFGRSK
jgi:hypothetical protein